MNVLNPSQNVKFILSFRKLSGFWLYAIPPTYPTWPDMASRLSMWPNPDAILIPWPHGGSGRISRTIRAICGRGGQVVSAGQAVVKLAQLNEKEVHIDVPEHCLGMIHPNRGSFVFSAITGAWKTPPSLEGFVQGIESKQVSVHDFIGRKPSWILE